MNEIKEKIEIIDINKIEENNIKEEEYKYNNNLEIDGFKYSLDYSTKLNSMDQYINNIQKQKLLNQIFLISSKLNMFNKIVSLDKLYSIIDSEKNFQMIYYIVSKMMKYVKTGRISVYMINTNLFFCSEFLSNNQNFYFAYKFFADLKKYNDYANFDKKLSSEINEFIKSKINYFHRYFLNLISVEQINILKDIINNILNEKNIIENDEDKNNQYLYAINKAWLQNAKIFIGNYIFAKETQATKNFFEDSFDLENVLSIFLSEDKKEKPIKNRTYYPFPGPINNFPLTDWKDILIDPLSFEENIVIKKYMLPKKDFYWINQKDWAMLNGIFSCTNEIKRKKSELEMIQINAFIFDSRIRGFKNESVNFMKKKVIQISKEKTIKDFEIKLIRCLDGIINKNNDEENKNEKIVYLYKINKKNKDIIIEMILSFIGDIQTYESIFLQKLNFSDEEKKNNIENIFKQYNPKSEILIIEIYQNNKGKNFLKPIIPQLNPNKQFLFNCSICNKEITDLNNANNLCELCSMFLFCSKQCSDITKNEDHSRLHNYLNELIIKPFDIKYFLPKSFYKDFYTLENKNKSKGVVGLYNLGNTCYMNCSLQCLSNTKDLTKYFINNNFQNEINLETTLGSNGVLVKSYSDLINLMWLSKFIRINPHFFRISFCISTNKFMNNNQQDAMEFISILLNYLHEDLNRIKKKPYLILKAQKENESDILASQRYYNYYLKRENSIITDLFSGQFQNIIKCTSCLVENKTYEPFNNISLPIPEEHNFYVIKFFSGLNCKYITINVKSDNTFEYLIKKASNYLSKKILDSLKEIKNLYKANDKYFEELLNKNIEIVKLDKDKIINEIYSQSDYNEKKLKDYIDNENEIVLFEKEVIPDYLQNIYVYPIKTNPNDDDDINFLSYPIAFSVKHDLTLENLEKIIVQKLSSILINDNVNKNGHIIDFHILHSNKNMNTGIMKIIKDYQRCLFCGNDYSEKKYCPLYLFFNKSDTVGKIFKITKNSNPFVLLARSSYYDLNKEVYQGFNFEENNILNKNKNIYDSFNQFGKLELLGEDNLWNCPICLTKRKIGKAIKIYRPPNYLIIQLKRFKKKSSGFFNFLEGDKNETFVSFPIKNLDLSNYIEGPEKNKSIYDLYAVINHKSLFGYNHFTAFCKNNKKWIEYDDHKINYDIKNPVTNEAYILFYIKKNIDENY